MTTHTLTCSAHTHCRTRSLTPAASAAPSKNLNLRAGKCYAENAYYNKIKLCIIITFVACI